MIIIIYWRNKGLGKSTTLQYGWKYNLNRIALEGKVNYKICKQTLNALLL